MTTRTNNKFWLKSAVSCALLHREHILLAGILLLALTVRLLGITWGFSTNGPQMAFHPDEGFAVMVIKQLHINDLDFNPESAHVEGTFYYYVTGGAYWIYKSGAALAALVGLPTLTISRYASLILIGRLVSIAAGTLSVFLLYHVARAAKLSKTAGLLAALVVAVYPIDIIYSQFMRPHILTNTLFILSLLALFLIASPKVRRYRYAIVGILLGLSTATRYNMAITLIIPAMYILIDSLENKRTLLQIVFTVDYAVLGFSFLFGVFLGDPYLFLKYTEMSYYLNRQSTFVPANAFALNNLADITYPLRYITYLIPESGKPFLAIGIYVSVFLALIRRSKLKIALPLVMFFLVYTYLMGKGYARPIFARAMLPLVPAFALLIAISYENIFSLCKQSYQKILFPLLIILLSCFSLIFVVKYYSLVLNTEEPRYTLREALISSGIKNVTIEKWSVCVGSITSVLQGASIKVRVILPQKQPEYVEKQGRNAAFIFCTYNATSDERISPFIASMPKTRVTKISRDQEPQITMGLPHDMLYPFTVFYIVQ